MADRVKVKEPPVSIPRDLDEVANLIAEIGKAKLAIEETETRTNKRIEQWKKVKIMTVAKLEEIIRQHAEAIRAFADPHKITLTKKGKTIKLPSGSFGWRTTPLSMEIADEEAVIAELKRRRLRHLIRVEEKVDKEKAKKEKDKVNDITGVSFTQKEEFFVTPAKVEMKIGSYHEVQERKI